MKSVHLTMTGYHAGAVLCGADKDSDGEYCHAAYAPLHRQEYKERVCPVCIRVWDAADDGCCEMMIKGLQIIHESTCKAVAK